jgi:HK97 family phage major capsid protein
LKANFLTTTGWPPESTRIPGLVIEYPVRPIQLLDLIPTGTTNQAAVPWVEETTRTHAAAERAEAAAYAESTFALTPRSVPVRSIGDSIPVSDEQLEDVAGVQSYLNNRLTFGVRQRLDGQVLNGDGTAPNLLGILNVTGIQTRAKGATEPAFDAIGKAIKDVQVTGRAFPNVIVMHPTDWWNIRLTRAEGSGIYILGNPGDNVEPRLFGLRVALSDAFPSAGTALVADLNHCQLFERRGLEIEVGYVGNQFTSGMRTIRASLRVAFAVYRPAAFCTVTEL